MSKEIARGVDLGWVSQLESMGVTWEDENGNSVDPLQALKDMGANAVRLRVFVNPPKSAFWQKREDETCMLGFADARSVMEMSKRVKAMGLKLMIDFHYSDHFADPQFQDIPKAWEEDDEEGLKQRVYHHTKEVLTLLTDNGIYPEWVQVGNEINPGLLLPKGDLKNAPEAMVSFLNAGYDAVKECCPDCQVITHLAGGHRPQWCDPFWETFFSLGGKTDILGFSHYPYWFNYEEQCKHLAERLCEYHAKYHKPVLVAEVGGPEDKEEETYELLADTIKAVESVPEGQGLGVFYWEPAVGKDILPDKYPLGAAVLVKENVIRFTKAMTAYRK